MGLPPLSREALNSQTRTPGDMKELSPPLREAQGGQCCCSSWPTLKPCHPERSNSRTLRVTESEDLRLPLLLRFRPANKTSAAEGHALTRAENKPRRRRHLSAEGSPLFFSTNYTPEKSCQPPKHPNPILPHQLTFPI